MESGQRIGGLVIGDLLGRGAMGEVYLAEQVSLKRPVAVKRIASNLTDDEEILQRFEREAQCIAKVQHPNVLSVYEFGTFPDERGERHTLLVMELVAGGCSLRDVDPAAADWRTVSSVIMQVAEALAAAAEFGIVHRDIKPDNIMLSAKGEAKLADFGLAKAADSLGMTMSGSVLGTPYYMSPEACLGDPVGHAGDLYSLGATWYHCLAGRPLFESQTTMAILRAHVEDPPEPVRSYAPDLPVVIAELVERCVAKRAEDRPASAQELADVLRELRVDGRGLPRRVPELVPAPAPAPAPAAEPASQREVSRSDRTALDPDETNPTTLMAKRQKQAARVPAPDDADSLSLPPQPRPPAASLAPAVPDRSPAPPDRRGAPPLVALLGLAGVLLLGLGGAAAVGGWWLSSRPAGPDPGGSGSGNGGGTVVDDGDGDAAGDPSAGVDQASDGVPDGPAGDGDGQVGTGTGAAEDGDPEGEVVDGDPDGAGVAAAAARGQAACALDDVEGLLAAEDLEGAWQELGAIERERIPADLHPRLDRLRALAARHAGEAFARGLRAVGAQARQRAYGSAVDVLLGLKTAAAICEREEDRQRLIAILEKAGNARDARQAGGP